MFFSGHLKPRIHVSQMDDIARKITFLMQIVLIILLWLLVSFLTDTRFM